MLRPKVLIDPHEKLLTKYYAFLDIFSYILAERLSLSRPNIDYKIILEKTPDKKDPEVL